MASETSPSRWIPLESNPDVLNSWATKAGLLASQAHFEDIYGLDEELLGMVPQPVLAVILLFPITPSSEAERREGDEKIKNNQIHRVDPTVLWIKQTISNACGTIAILHALANSHVAFSPESPLQKFIFECQNKTPEERAKFLETTPLFASIHADAASGGQTAVPTNLDVDLHFTCFVAAPDAVARQQSLPAHATASPENGNGGMRLVELDGRRAGPIDRGDLEEGRLLSAVADFVKIHYMHATSSMQFSMIALVGKSDEKLD